MEGGERRAGVVRAALRVGAAALDGAFSTVIGPEAGGATAQALAEIGETLVGFVERRAQQRVALTLKATSEELAGREEREMIAAAGAEGAAIIHFALGIELSELAGRGLEFIGLGQEGGAVADPASTWGGGTITSQTVAQIRPTGLGETVGRLGELADIVSAEELDGIAADLRGPTVDI